jgi:Glycosyl hydrolase family 65, C-terminal domain
VRSELRFGLRYRGHWGIEVTCPTDLLRVALRPAAASPVTLSVAGRTVSIDPGSSWETAFEAGRLPTVDH